ncbi:MAG: hypothetical protein ACLSWR_01070 [Ruthenibacterium sp.]
MPVGIFPAPAFCGFAGRPGRPPGFGPAGTGLRAFPNALRKPGANHCILCRRKEKNQNMEKIHWKLLQYMEIYGKTQTVQSTTPRKEVKHRMEE